MSILSIAIVKMRALGATKIVDQSLITSRGSTLLTRSEAIGEKVVFEVIAPYPVR
jgi:hypothetical protein